MCYYNFYYEEAPQFSRRSLKTKKKKNIYIYIYTYIYIHLCPRLQAVVKLSSRESGAERRTAGPDPRATARPVPSRLGCANRVPVRTQLPSSFTFTCGEATQAWSSSPREQRAAAQGPHGWDRRTGSRRERLREQEQHRGH